MKYKFAIVFISVIGLLLSGKGYAHTEIAGKLIFENYNNELYVKAILDKKLLSIALTKEGDCLPKEMLSECGDEYVQRNIHITINCTEVGYEKIALEIRQKDVMITYKVSCKDEPIQSIGVNSTYMLKYNDHAIVRAQFAIDQSSKSYDLTANRQTIEANFNQL